MYHGKRIAYLYCGMIAMFLFLILRLYMIMTYDAASEVLSGQYSRKMSVTERRGFIYDRNGKLLNSTADGFVCLVDPSGCTDKKAASEKLASVSELTHSQVYEKMLKGIPFVVETSDTADADGVYPYPLYIEKTQCAPHIVGYTDGEGRGTSGIEKSFDRTLSGLFSARVDFRYKANALGVPFAESGSSIHDTGMNRERGIYTTIDKDLQLFCEELARKYIEYGAICVCDTKSGEVLAMVSVPDFDTENVADYLDSTDGELINRCLSGFTPGSIFKTVVAAAALESSGEYSERLYRCTGTIVTADGDILPCHNRSGHGLVDMRTAYAQSCNTYFIDLASAIGAEAVAEMAQNMGLTKGKSLDGIFFYADTVPEYSEVLSSRSGYLANLAIGQGRLLVSPLGACELFSCAASGYRTESGILSRISDSGCVLREYSSNRKKERVLTMETVGKLRDMMSACVEEGLGKSAASKDGKAGGKTSTAQSGSFRGASEILNCWFCGIYPAEDPFYTVCVLSCDTKNTGAAKRVFKEICDRFVEQSQS